MLGVKRNEKTYVKPENDVASYRLTRYYSFIAMQLNSYTERYQRCQQTQFGASQCARIKSFFDGILCVINEKNIFSY